MEKVKESTTWTKKRILSLLAALLMALTCLPFFAVPYMVDAAQLQVHPYLVRYGSAYGSAFVNRPMGAFNKAHTNGWKIYVDLPTGRTIAYCLGYGQPLSKNDLVTQDQTYDNLSRSQQRLIQRAIVLGYNDTTAVTKSLNDWDYAATQIVIWLVQGGYFNTGNEAWMVDTLAEIGGASKAEVVSKYYALKDKILYATANPSFASTDTGSVPTYQMIWDNNAGQYVLTLDNTNFTNANLVYNYMEFSNTNNSLFTYSVDANNRNRLTIRTTGGAGSRGSSASSDFTANNSIGRMLATGTDSGIVDGSVESWSKGGKQPTATFSPNSSDPIPSYFRVEIASGILTIQKEFVDGNGEPMDVPKSGVQVQIVGKNTGYSATYTTDSNGTIRQWVPSDTYTITEVNTGQQWVQPASQTATVNTGSETTATITNKPKQWNLTIHKEDAETGENIQSAIFSVYNSKDEVVADNTGETRFVTDMFGNVTTGYFDCGSGYYLKEIQSAYGYVYDPDAKYPITGTEGEGTVATVNLSKTIPNTQGTWKLTVHKTDVNTGANLAGVQFQILKDGEVQTDSEGHNVFTTDSSGRFTTGEFKTGRDFYLQEIYVPDNLVDANGNQYVLDDSLTPISGTWTYGATSTLELFQEVKNVPDIPIELSVFKTSADTNSPISDVTFELRDGDNVIGSYTTDSDGKIFVDGLSPVMNGLTLYETKVPSAYLAYSKGISLPMSDGKLEDTEENLTSESGHTIHVVAHYNSSRNVIEISVEIANPTAPGALIIKKVDQNGNPIAGVTFGLYASDRANPPANYMGYAGEQITTAVTDENGYAVFSLEYNPSTEERNNYEGTMNTSVAGNWYLIRDYYYLKEESVPDNCVMANPNFWLVSYNYKALGMSYAGQHGVTGYYWISLPDNYQSQTPNSSTNPTGTEVMRTGGIFDTVYYYAPDAFQIVNNVGDGSLTVNKYGYESATGSRVPLEGVTFGLFDAELPEDEMVIGNTIGDPVTTGPDGTCEFTHLPFGTYVLKELASDGERALTDQTYRFTVSATDPDHHFTYTQYNYHPNQITGIKYGVDGDGVRTPLSGAVIGLFRSTVTEYTAENALQTVTSGADGSFAFSDIGYDSTTASGTFVIAEITPPPGYEKTDEVHTVQLRYGFIYRVDGEDYQDGTQHTVSFTFDNTLIPVYIQGLKTGTDYTGSTNPLANVLIGLFDAKETNYTSVHALQTITTGSDGLFRFDNLDPNGSYKVVELSAPTGWIKSDTVFTVTFYNGGVQQLSGAGAVLGEDGHSVYITIDNPQPTVWVEGIKYGIAADDTRNPLAGATIGIFDSSVTEYTEANALDTAITGTDGSFRFDSLNPNGSYKIVELVAPTGYAKSDTVLTARFQGGTAVDGDGDHFEFEIENYQYAANLRIIKADENGSLLNGVTFGLFSENAAEYTSANAIRTAVTSNGECIFQDVPYGNYAVVELSGLDGYMMDSTPQYVTVNAATDGQTIELHYTNPTAPYSIRGHKVDEHGTALQGALFGLYWADQHYDTYTDQNAIMTAESGSDGVFEFTPVAAGDYVVVELSAPVDANGIEYALDQTPHPVSVALGSPAVVEIDNIVNVPVTGNIRGVKVDPEGQLMSGIVFGLYAYDDTDYSDPLQTATTDTQGVFEFHDVYLGSYWVREIETEIGYQVDETAYPANVSQNEVTIYVGTITNYRLGTIYGTKVSTDGTMLEGAKFGLYTSAQTNPTEAGAALTAVSGEDGIFSFSDLQFDTTYYLYELEAPANHQKIDGLIWSGQVTEDIPAINVGQVENTPSVTTITGTKLDGNTNNPLAGATIGLYDAAKVTSWQQANRDNALMVVTTLEDGVFTFSGTMDKFAESMVIYEIEAPKNYQVITDPLWTGNLGDTPQTIYVGNIYNYPETFSIDGVKVDESSAPLAGAVFGLFNAADVSSREDVTEDNALQTYTTGDDGSFVFADITYNADITYAVYEIKAPEGKRLIENAVWTGTAEEAQTIHIGNIVNYPDTFDLTGTKVNGDGENLSGAVFGIYDASQVTRWDQASEENAIATAKSNDSGAFAFTGIPCGSTTYVVYELQAPEGYDLRKDVIWTGTNTDGSTINLGDVVNYTHQELPGTGGSGQNPIQSALAVGLLGCAVIGFGYALTRAKKHRKEGDAK